MTRSSAWGISLLLFLGWLVPGLAGAEPGSLGLQVPAEFEVTLYADDSLAHDIYSLTIDAQGRVVVAGAGYVKTLHDDNGDGRADRATLYSPLPKSGAHGLCFDGSNLLATGDNGVWWFTDENADGQADGPGQLVTSLKHSEHGANGIVRGPDGWFYVICGNDANVSTAQVTTDRSPVREPRCGGVVRIAPDFKQLEVVTHGLRNAYDLDFDRFGHLYTVDSDNEREHALPWYMPTRLFDLAQGQEQGWLLSGFQRSWNRPAALFDSVERLAELGRGSPTGVAVYRHHAFPERYREGVFSLCWSLGRVYFLPVDRQADGYRASSEIFLRTVGDVGFAPCDLAVGPAGDLFVAVGGRGTRGSVFRVRLREQPPAVEPPTGKLARVLSIPQPSSSWSRAEWVPLAQALGAAPFEVRLLDPNTPQEQRLRALEVLTELFGGPPSFTVRTLLADDDPAVRARLAWALGRASRRDATEPLVRLTQDASPWVQRAAWESLATLPTDGIDPTAPQPSWRTGLESPVRRVSAAATQTAQRWQPSLPADLDPLARARVEVPRLAEPFDAWASTWDGVLDRLREPRGIRDRIDAVRWLQLAWGDMSVDPGKIELYAGYTPRRDPRLPSDSLRRLADVLAQAWEPLDPASDEGRELARLVGLIGLNDPAWLDRLARAWSDTSTPQDDVHYLIVASRLAGERSSSFTTHSAATLVALPTKLARGNIYPDRNWPLRMGELFDALVERDPRLARAIVEQPEFGQVGHALWGLRMPLKQRQSAARRILGQLKGDEDAPWSVDVVTLIASLPDDESLPALRARWDDFTLRDSIAGVLASRGQQEDRPRLIEALGSLQPSVVNNAAEALTRLDTPWTGAELVAPLRALRGALLAADQQPVRLTLQRLLQQATGESLAVVERPGTPLTAQYQPWFTWFEQAHASAAKQLSAGGTADIAALLDRFETLDDAGADLARGKIVFEKRACQRCHVGGGRLGPSLAGAAQRFSRRDLLAAIVDPSKEVAPLYRTSQVVTHGGQVYVGLSVYQSAEYLLLQTTPDTTVRLEGRDIASITPSRQSLMPSGLLNQATDQEILDLIAYLRTLQADR